jgi:DNA-binding NtrC family response regulator
MKILIVEDDLLQSSWLENSLNEHGHDVRCASGGDEGLRSWEFYRPEIVITDYRIVPQVVIRNGLDLIAAIRSIDPLQQFVLQTAEKDLKPPIGVPLLRKPYKFRQLAKLIDSSPAPLQHLLRY